MQIALDDVRQVIRDVFGAPADHIDWPGGRDRRTFVAVHGDQRYVLSRRGGPGRARLEAHILGCLGPAGLSPVLIKLHGDWVVQSFVPGLRLAQHLTDGPGKDDAVIAAARSLALFQHRAGQAGLTARVPTIGARPGWVMDFLRTAAGIAAEQDWPEPRLDLDRLASLLTAPPKTFVKWDARPGNALIHEDTARPVWIDWEHAGRRVAADDLCWLVCDEWFPCDQSLEDSAIAAYRDGQDEAVSYDFEQYVRVFGVFHMLVRVSLMLRQLRRRGWGDDARQLRLDLIGTSPARLASLCDRGERWAGQTADTAVLRDLFSRIGALTTAPTG